MTIQETFCPKCGGPSEGGLCARCRVAGTEWLECEPRRIIVWCPTCGSVKTAGVWTDTPSDREETAAELARLAVRLHSDVQHIQTGMTCNDPSPNRTICDISVTGTLYGMPVTGNCRVEIIWKKEQCDRCSRYSGGYYEGIVQVRATDRKPDPFEVDRAIFIAQTIEDELQTTGERLSFISKIDETRDGPDIVVGSQHLGDRVSREIVRELGGRYRTHPKLIGERDGKKIFRVTYSVRLPCFQKGDIISLSGKYYEIREMDQHTMKVFDLQEGILRTIQEDCSARKVGNIRDAEQALVAFIDGQVAGILDPKTFRTEEYPVSSWLNLVEGSHIRVLRDPDSDTFILVG